MSIKCACSIIASKRLVVIKTLFPLVVYYIATTLQKELFNNFINKYKTKVIPIIYIIKVINTLKYNDRQA